VHLCILHVHQNKQPLLPTYNKAGGFYKPNAVCLLRVTN